MRTMSSLSSLPARVCICFDSISPAGVDGAEQRDSLCASGFVFVGQLHLRGTDGQCMVTLPVQTGGWMSRFSPFARAGLCPADTSWGSYVPQNYPDTAFPALSAPTSLGTLRTGMLRGFRVPDPPGTGRTDLMVHAAERFGSEGCISTPDAAGWEAFCAQMAALYAAGVGSIPLEVIYTCEPPNPTRFPHDDAISSNLP